MSGWRYFAQRFDGTGNLGEFMGIDLPLTGVTIDENLSGHNSMAATISPKLARLVGTDGRPIFDEYGVCIWAESPNGEVYGGILEKSGFNGPTWNLDCADLTSISIGMPYGEANYFIGADPMDLFRMIWMYIQLQPGGNLGINIDQVHSPIRLGVVLDEGVDYDEALNDPIETPESAAPNPYPDNATWEAKVVKKLKKLQNSWTGTQITNAIDKWLAQGKSGTYSDLETKIIKTAKRIVGPPPNPHDAVVPIAPTAAPKDYESGAYKLQWYANTDLSQDLTDLATNTPFDWYLQHYWSDDGDEPDLFHQIRLGYPQIGRKITDLRFVIGENIQQVPEVDRDGAEFATEVIVLGAGEGAAMVRGRAYRERAGRMRRPLVITDSTITNIADANHRAEAEVAARANIDDIQQVIITEHPHAPLGSVQLGDTFLLEGDTGWNEVSVWVRVLGRSFSPDDTDSMTLTVARSDQLVAGGTRIGAPVISL